MPVNDADWDNTPILDEDFFLNTEPVYSPDAQMPQLELPDNIKVFSEEARAFGPQAAGSARFNGTGKKPESGAGGI